MTKVLGYVDECTSHAAFFKALPHRDFFQYPPINVSVNDGSPFPPDRLQLGEEIGEDFFTIFVSVPYCRVRCNICPYFVSLLPKNKDRHELMTKYAALLYKQISHFAGSRRFNASKCKAIYMGGGTASLLSPEHVAKVIRQLKGSVAFADDIEITLEGNPKDFSADYFQQVRRAGVNRVSLGYQSSQDDILIDVLNSPHRSNESLMALKDSLATGFRTVNVDMLYRLPGQTFEQWQQDIRVLLEFAPASVTTYEYVVHGRTSSEAMLLDGRLKRPVDRVEALKWYEWAKHQMLEAGYLEASYHVFAKPGHLQQYSEYAYGKGAELIGLGAKAFSYINGHHFSTPSTIPRYEKAVSADDFPFAEIASVTPSRRNSMERYVIFRLRRESKVDGTAFLLQFGARLADVFKRETDFLLDMGTIELDDSGGVALTELGRLWRYNVLESFYDADLR